jgi:hypothetical protein
MRLDTKHGAREYLDDKSLSKVSGSVQRTFTQSAEINVETFKAWCS